MLDEAGEIVACGPEPSGAGLGEAAAALWEAASRATGSEALEHLVAPLPGGTVAMVQAHGRRAVALTGPRPAVALLLFDLRTCLADAFATPEAAA